MTKPRPGTNPREEGADTEGGDQEPSKQDGRPSPGGVPNEGKASYKYKGGRQATGGIPNPDDTDDDESAGSFRGTGDPKDGLRNPK